MKIKTSVLKLSSVAALMMLVQGCSTIGVGESEFACKGYPEGLRCMSAQDVYEITDDDEYKERIEEISLKQGGNPTRGTNPYPEKEEDGSGDIHHSSKKAVQAQKLPDTYIRSVLPKPTRGTIPLRTPAQVLRVYVNAWESDEGDLNVPSYVYTEIEPRRWMIGSRKVKSSNALTPLQVPDSEKEQDARKMKEQQFRSDLQTR